MVYIENKSTKWYTSEKKNKRKCVEGKKSEYRCTDHKKKRRKVATFVMDFSVEG